MVDFYSLLDIWEGMGVFNVILPFLLIFTVVYAVLDKIHILGSKKAPNAVVSLVVALLVIRSPYIIGLLNRFLPNIAMFLVIILMFLLMLGTFTGKKHQDWAYGLAFLVSIVFVIWALASDYLGDFLGLPAWLSNLDETTKASILFIGIFVAIIFLVMREGGESGEKKKNIFEKVADLTKGEE